MHSVCQILIHIPACLMLLAGIADYTQVASERACSLLNFHHAGAHRARYNFRFTSSPQSGGSGTLERQKEVTRAEFTRNFGGLQQVGQALLREHEARKLSPEQLAKEVKAINRHAKNLRGLLVLGELKSPVQESREPLDTPRRYDQSIRRLARLIYTFAHNPVHQNRRVFDTAQAQRALVDLENIILLSKAIENQAKGYRAE
jgi:ribosomal protein L29